MSAFSNQIISWYKQNKRDLPWRNTVDPYFIWLSEVILQQTRVLQGLPYYDKFVSTYPTVRHLAKADEMEVLKLWQGLGYYSRARNLLKTARHVSEFLENKFPLTYNELIELPGIGPYTAAAIASFANNERVAVVDGNVYRVLSRVFGISTPIDSTDGKKEFQQLATELMGNEAALHNQAIMEFGATVCKPKQPSCEDCVLRTTCFAFENKQQDQLPVKAKKTTVKTRHFNYLVFNHQQKIFLKKRPAGDIWQGLYDFPLLESNQGIDHPEWLFQQTDFPNLGGHLPVFTKKSPVYKHLLTHREIQATFWEFKLEHPVIEENLVGISNRQSDEYPMPQLIVNYLKNNHQKK